MSASAMTSIRPQLWVENPREASRSMKRRSARRSCTMVGEGDDIVAHLAVVQSLRM
jgi:hypothetical protein